MASSSSVNDMPKDNDEIRTKYFETKRKEFEEGCFAQKQSDACFCLAEWHQVVAKDLKRSGELYASNCLDNKHHGSCYNLAIQLLAAGSGQEAEIKAVLPEPLASQDRQVTARQLLKESCEVGKHPVACLSYASMLLAGLGGERDLPTAMSLLESNCYRGNDSRACVKLGTVFLRGDPTYPGVPKDAKRAFQHMKHACDELGHPNGCQVLAVMYKFGDAGLPVDLDKSRHYQKLTKDLAQQTGDKLGNVSVGVSL